MAISNQTPFNELLALVRVFVRGNRVRPGAWLRRARGAQRITVGIGTAPRVGEDCKYFCGRRSGAQHLCCEKPELSNNPEFDGFPDCCEISELPENAEFDLLKGCCFC